MTDAELEGLSKRVERAKALKQNIKLYTENRIHIQQATEFRVKPHGEVYAINKDGEHRLWGIGSSVMNDFKALMLVQLNNKLEAVHREFGET